MPFLAAIPAAAAIGAGASALGPIVGNAIGSIASSGDRAKAQQAAQEAFDQINQLGAPPDLANQILLSKFQSAGVLTPDLEKQINLGVSQVSQIKDNPALQNAQSQALQLIQQRAQGGLSGQDRAALNQIRAQAQQDTEAKRQQIIQNMQQRGLAGSGTELAAQLAAAQGGAQQESEAGDRIGAMAAQNALQAIGQQSGMASQQQGQQFQENLARSQAADEFARFNVSNQLAQQARNIAAQNQAQQLNLNNAQQIANANTSQGNQELLREQQAKAQNWQNQMQLAQAKAAALGGQSQYYQNQAQNTAQGWGNVGSGLGAAGGSLANFSMLQGLLNKNNGQQPANTSNLGTSGNYTSQNFTMPSI